MFFVIFLCFLHVQIFQFELIIHLLRRRTLTIVNTSVTLLSQQATQRTSKYLIKYTVVVIKMLPKGFNTAVMAEFDDRRIPMVAKLRSWLSWDAVRSM